MIGGLRHAVHDGLHGFTGRGRPFRAFHRTLGGMVYGRHGFFGLLLNAAHSAGHFAGSLHGFFGQVAHLVGHHGETATGLARPGGLNGRVQGQQIGLIGHIIDKIHHVADGPGFFAQAGHGFFQGQGAVLDLGYGLHGHAQFFGTGTSGLARALGLLRSGARTVRHIFNAGRNTVHSFPCLVQAEALIFHSQGHLAHQLRKLPHLTGQREGQAAALIRHSAHVFH